MFKGHPHWIEVETVVNKLNKAGYKAWLAGGCVRDFLLKRAPKDFDVVTDAKPTEIERLFPKALEVGKKFGIIILPFDGFQIEVATFRKDGEYKDGRHPESISFATPEEDAKRRDFTINALFYDPQNSKIIDYVDGEKDIKKQIIRTVGLATKRFDEDKLRVLRAFRFCAQLGFSIEEKTFLESQKFSLNAVSRERVRDELLKLLGGQDRIRALSLLDQSGAFLELLPEINETLYAKIEIAKDINPWTLTKTLLQTPTELPFLFFFAPFLKTLGIERLDKLVDRFKLSREDANILDFVVRHWEGFASLEKRKRSYLLTTFSHRYGRGLFEFYEKLSVLLGASEWANIKRLVSAALPPNGKLPEAWVTANDLMALGLSGAALGEALKKTFAWQLDGEAKDKSELLARINKKGGV